MSSDNVEISTIDGVDAELLRKYYIRPLTHFNGTLAPTSLADKLNKILDFNVRDDDIWVCSVPKAGTTWTQEMVWCIANDFDFKKAEIPLSVRYTFFDRCFTGERNASNEKQSERKRAEKMLLESESTSAQSTGRRFIKTHLPYDLLPQKLRDGSTTAKIVFITRDPRDVCISFYHHVQRNGLFRGNLEQFCELFTKGLVPFMPYWKLVLGYWNRQNDENLLFLKYEDMKNNLAAVIRKTASFLEKPIADNDVDSLCVHLSFDTMKRNHSLVPESWAKRVENVFGNVDAIDLFFRSGRVDQWKTEMKPETIDTFEKWETENLRNLQLANYSSI